MPSDAVRPKAADLFAGCGGIGLALRRAGFDVEWACEIDQAASSVYEDNFGHRPFGDIFGLDLESLPMVNLVAGGFPCQPYSKAGKRRGLGDERADTFTGMMRVIKAVRPDAVLIENVPGLLNQGGGEAFKFVVDSLGAAGFPCVSHAVLDATDFGGSQHRERLFIVAGAVPFDFGSLPRRPHGSLADVLEDVGEDAWMRPEEYTLLKESKRQASGMVFAGYRNKKMRLPEGSPASSGNHYQQNRIYSSRGVSHTISSQEVSGRHWVEHCGRARRLTRLEVQRLQGFPDDFRFGSPSTFYRQVGNSVHVPTVEAIARGVLDTFFMGRG